MAATAGRCQLPAAADCRWRFRRRRAAAAALTPDRVLQFVGRIYEQAFGILQIMGDAEADGA